MKQIWQIKDLIDLEYFLNRENQKDNKSQNNSDNKDNYPKDIIFNFSNQIDLSRSYIIRQWLEVMRNAEIGIESSKTILPGDIFDEVNKFLRHLFLIIGIIAGATLAFTLLSYQGNNPINISTWLGTVVLSQIVLLFILLTGYLLRRLNLSKGYFSILYPYAGSIFAKLIMYFRKKSDNKLSPEKRAAIQASLSVLRKEKKIYGAVFYRPVFILTQIFGIGFNIGILFATILRVVGSDIAFGWQSTIQLSSQIIYQIVKTIAIPWSWFIPKGIAFPSLVQIEGSRLVLKDGISQLATNNLTAWWPFLCLVVLFYGLFPRMVLLYVGFVGQRKSIAGLDFNHSDCDKLMQKLQAPDSNTKEEPFVEKNQKTTFHHVTNSNLHSHNNNMDKITETTSNKGIFVLIPDDIFNNCKTEELKNIVKKLSGYNMADKKKIGIDFNEDLKVIESLVASSDIVKNKTCTKRTKENILQGVMILQEAWQPPIKEFFLLIKKLREESGCKTPLIVALIGKPKPETIFTPVSHQDFTVWEIKIDALGDPWLRLEKAISYE